MDKLINEVKTAIEDNDLVYYIARFTQFDNKEIFEVVLDNKEKNIGMDQITKFSPIISKIVDKYEKDMPENYYLQIISPGIRRRLYSIENYEQSINKEISIKYHNGDKTVKVIGTLKSINPISLETKEQGELEIKFESIKEGK
jgi:ribosome maturation factor RimP